MSDVGDLAGAPLSMIRVKSQKRLGGFSGGNCLRLAAVIPDMAAPNMCHPLPSPARPGHSYVARLVRFAEAHILTILGLRRLSQIFKAVIRLISVDMVDPDRVAPMHELPNNPVRLVVRAINFSVLIAARPVDAVKCSLPGPARVPRRCHNHVGEMIFGPPPPKKQTCFAFVAERLAKKISIGQFFGSHVVSPHVRGQGRALLTQRFRPAFPSRITVCSQGGGA